MLMMRVRVGIFHSSSNSSINCNPSVSHLLELLSDFLQGSVDMELWSLLERLLAEGTLVELGASSSSSVPVGGDAGLAETVAA